MNSKEKYAREFLDTWARSKNKLNSTSKKSRFRNRSLGSMTTPELLNHLYYLGTLHHKLEIYELNEFYDEIENTENEILIRSI